MFVSYQYHTLVNPLSDDDDDVSHTPSSVGTYHLVYVLFNTDKKNHVYVSRLSTELLNLFYVFYCISAHDEAAAAAAVAVIIVVIVSVWRPPASFVFISSIA